jgi:hypothetical protein
MKRIAVMVCAVLGLALSSSRCWASWGAVHYSGYQPWYNIFAKRYKGLTPEEERLQKFWHDYYDALKEFYCALDHVDWVAYYKNHGYQINGGCCGPCGGGRINYAPVFVSPTLQWAVPQCAACGPPMGPGGPPPMMGGGGPPMMGGPPPGMFGPMPFPPPGGYGPPPGYAAGPPPPGYGGPPPGYNPMAGGPPPRGPPPPRAMPSVPPGR